MHEGKFVEEIKDTQITYTDLPYLARNKATMEELLIIADEPDIVGRCYLQEAELKIINPNIEEKIEKCKSRLFDMGGLLRFSDYGNYEIIVVNSDLTITRCAEVFSEFMDIKIPKKPDFKSMYDAHTKKYFFNIFDGTNEYKLTIIKPRIW